MIRRDGLAYFIMLTTFATTRSTLAADWSESLETGGIVAYVTNPLLLPRNSQSDESEQLTMDGTTSAQTERSQFTLTPRVSLTRYDHGVGFDENTGTLDLSYVEKSERGQWTVTGEALTDTTATSELGTSGIIDVNRRRYANTAAIGYQYAATERLSWQAQAAWQDTRYSDAVQYGLTDYQYFSAVGGPIWSLTERIQGLLVLEADQLSPQAGSTEHDYSATVQLKRAFNEQYSWRISAGSTHVEAGSSASGSSSAFEIGATRQGERVQWDVSVKQAVLPIGLGLLAREDIGALSLIASITERTTLNVTVNSTHSDPVAVSVYLLPGVAARYQIYTGAAWQMASVNLNHQLTEQWSVQLGFAESRARNYVLPYWGDGDQAHLNVLWQSGRL